MQVLAPSLRRLCTATSCAPSLRDVAGTHVELDVLPRCASGRSPHADLRLAVDLRVEEAQRGDRTGLGQRVDASASRPGSARPCRTASSTIQSLFIALSTDVAIDVLADAANTVMKATSATPIINADDVAAVRRGFRIAFSRASVPAMPRTCGSGEPTMRANRRAIDRTEHRDADEHGQRTEADGTGAGTGQALGHEERAGGA